MRIAYFDCTSGISGDMTLAALIDCGASLTEIQQGVDSMVPGITLSTEETRKLGFRARKLNILAPPDPEHRDFQAVLGCIERCKMSVNARRLAIRIFERLARAEAKVHGVAIDQVHFHEVGAIDSIIDIVGFAIAWDHLGIQKGVASPVPTGSGQIRISHGLVSVPAPATAELLKGIPIASCELPFELTTPTGAAILAEVVQDFGGLPTIQIDAIGCGSGSRDLPDRPNLLRVYVGKFPGKGSESTTAHSQSGIEGKGIIADSVIRLETNVDDITGEQIGFALECLWEDGALEAYTTPIQMKKNRPGILLTVLAKPEDADRIEKSLFRYTGTLGIRKTIQSRSILPREKIELETAWGKVPCKLVWMVDGSRSISPEYDACRKIALDQGLTLQQVVDQVIRVSEQRFPEQKPLQGQ